jgi:hypothetical protein
MRSKILALAFAGALALTGCTTTGAGGGGYGAAPQTRLSQCTRNALIGAGVGALVGAAQDSRNNRGENAAMGAAVGGLGTYGVCRWLSARERQRVEQSYQQSLNSGAPVNQTWQGDQGDTRYLNVSQPQPSSRGPQCRTVNATVSDGSARQALPAETFCRDGAGNWVPA